MSCRLLCRSPQGERGLKSPRRVGVPHLAESLPRKGERGLKYVLRFRLAFVEESLPARGTWIEIARSSSRISWRIVALRKGNVD